MAKLSLLFLLVLSAVCLQCYSKPAVAPSSPAEDSHPLSPELESARQVWNGARKAYKGVQKQLRPRSRRQVGGNGGTSTTPQYTQEDLSAITGPKYIVDLFKNISNSTSKPTQVNTIRALNYFSKSPAMCGEYNFSIASINRSEYILKTEFRLFLEDIIDPTVSYTFEIVAVDADGHPLLDQIGNVVKTTDDFPAAGEGHKHGYVTFEVDGLLDTLISLEEKFAVFRVRAYKDITTYHTGGDHMECNAVKFIYHDYNDDNKPELMVYSYDHKIDSITYKQVMERLASTPTEDLSLTQPQQQGRKKRTVAHQTPDCTANDLHIEGSKIFEYILGLDPGTFEVEFPEVYNAGICGGLCHSSTPINSPHSTLLSLLLGESNFRDSLDYEVQKCCTPVKYRELSLLYILNGEFMINIINDLIIDKCECLDIVVFS